MTTLPIIQPTWFDSYGYLLGVLPADCIADCAHAGPCDDDVKSWRERLKFAVPRDRATAYIREFGAWTGEELAAKTDEDLAEVVLWLACCQIRESGEWLGLAI
jgi:hypothetical protein